MPLEPRFILGAPITLASDGLVLSSPTSPAELIGVQAEPAPLPAPSSGPAPLPPAADPLSPVGDPVAGSPKAAGDATLASCDSSSSTYSVNVWMAPIAGDVTDVLEFGATSGRFRFHATACGSSGLPTYVDVNYGKAGTVSAGDYSGPLKDNTTVRVQLDGSDTNKSGMALREFTAVDDLTEEPDSPETLIVTINGATDSNGQGANLLAPLSGQGTIRSNDYLPYMLPGQAPISARAGDPAPLTSVHLRLRKDQVEYPNGVQYAVLWVHDTTGGNSDALITSPPIGGAPGETQTRTIGEDRLDGVATVVVYKNNNSVGAGGLVIVGVQFYPTDASQPENTLRLVFDVNVAA